MLEFPRHFFDQQTDLIFSLPVNKDRAAKHIPLADDRPVFNFTFGDEENRKNTTEHDAVNVAHVVGDDDIAAPFQLAFIADDADFDVENQSQQQGVVSVEPADDLPAIGQPEDRHPKMHGGHQDEENRPQR